MAEFITLAVVVIPLVATLILGGIENCKRGK